jgi:hypothetical protein
MGEETISQEQTERTEKAGNINAKEQKGQRRKGAIKATNQKTKWEEAGRCGNSRDGL